MSSTNENFRKALVAFSQPGSNTQVFKAALENYIKSYNKTLNQQVKNILSGTTYTNVNTRQKLLNRLAQQTSRAAENAKRVGMPQPQLNQKNREIKVLLSGLRGIFTTSSPENIQWNLRIKSNLNRYNKNKVNQILRNNYNTTNPVFTREIRRVLNIATAAPPLPPKPLFSVSETTIPFPQVLKTYPVNQNKRGEIKKILEMIRNKGITSNWQGSISISRPYNAANINYALRNFEFSNQNKATIRNRLTRKL